MEDAKKAGQIYSKIGAIKIDPKTCFASGLLPPASRDITFMADKIDARLAEKSDAIDKGVLLTGFNDWYTGKAPDLGCYEYGKEIPHYGPRPEGFSLNKEILKFSSAPVPAEKKTEKKTAEVKPAQAGASRFAASTPRPKQASDQKKDAWIKAKLSLARNYKNNGLKEEAVKTLALIIKKHPDHPLTAQATKMLEEVR